MGEPRPKAAWRRCPFVAWGILYVAGIALADFLFRRFSAPLGLPRDLWFFSAVVVPTLAAGTLLAIRNTKGMTECEWLPETPAGWLVFMLASTVAGAFFLPVLSSSPEVSILLRALAAVFLVALSSLLVLHLQTHKAGTEAGGTFRRIAVTALSRLPLIILFLIVAVIILVAAIEGIFGKGVRSPL